MKITMKSMGYQIAAAIALAFGFATALTMVDAGPPSGFSASPDFTLPLYTGETLTLGADTQFLSQREDFSATVIPDGRVLILGGQDRNGSMVSASEAFNPTTAVFERLSQLHLDERAGQSATMLTDGRILVAGGIGPDGAALKSTRIIDTITWEIAKGPDLAVARKLHSARLLPSGAVLLQGGIGADGLPSSDSELFDPRTNAMSLYTDALRLENEERYQSSEPVVAEILPPHETRNVELDEFVAVRFSRAMNVASINGESLTLFGPTGVVESRVVPAEGGRLVIIVPTVSLMPGSRYSAFVQDVADSQGAKIAFTVSSFNTRAIVSPAQPRASQPVQPTVVTDPALVHPLAGLRWTPADATADSESWVPGEGNLSNGRWRDNRPLAKRALSVLPRAADGVTALSGRILRLNGNPLADVTVTLGDVSAKSDASGAFLLEGIKAGKGMLEVDGDTAGIGENKYGFYQILIYPKEGTTTELSYDVWMTKLDPKGTVKISSPTTTETIVTTPSIPGLELHIPAGTVVRGRDGKVVTEINITAIPVNRPPFPLPGLDIPTYFTIQPGGAWLQGVSSQASQGGQIYYPNYRKSLPGSRGEFYHYDPRGKSWYVYGEGQIDASGAQAIPDEKTRIYEFTGAMFNNGAPPLPGAPSCNSCPCSKGTGGGGSGGGGGGCGTSGGPGSERGGDPVSLSTGYFVRNENDLFIADVIPISISRSYRSQDNALRTFGIGWVLDYDVKLYSQNPYQEVDLIESDGGRVHYVRISPGVDYADAIFESTAPGRWYKSRIQRNNARFGWDLVFRDGTKWFFYEYQRLYDITDAAGNTLTIKRRDGGGYQGPITRIQSPNGRFVDFTLDASDRVTQISDSAGRTFSYTYDASGRLTKVTDPLSGERNYTYDSNHRLLTAKDPLNNVVVTNEYDANGRVFRQTLADSNTFQFAYTVSSGKVTQTDVTDQRGKVRRVQFNSSGYVTQSTAAYGTADAQQTSFSLDTYGQITAITDPLSRVTSYAFDGWGNRASVTRLYGTADAVTTSFTFTPGGERPASVTDPLGHTAVFTYDAAWNVLTATDPLSHTTTYTRDALGRVLTKTDALSHTWTYTYGGADIATMTDPLSRTTEYFTDVLGRAIAAKDPMGNITRLEYDVLDRLKKSTDPLAGFVEFGFDATGNLTSHKDQNTNATIYGFNSLGLISSKTDALSHAEGYFYGANGKVNQITDRKGQVTGLSYDNLNRVSQMGFGATVANPTTYTSTIGYTYDAGDRVTQIADSVGGTITRTYDGLDRMTQEQTPEGTVSYTYDNAGRRATMTVAGQSAVTYTWDNANRLTQIAQGSDAIGFAYDNANRRTSTTLANGVVMTYAYDNTNQLTSITYTKGAITIGDLQYTYDNAGRRTKISGSLAASDLPAATTSAIYSANNQLTSWGGVAHTYDLNGNLTGNGTNTYVWDARDQLASISGGIAANFAYDGLSRRKSKSIAGTQTGFLYDGMNFVQELTGTTPKANLITGGIDEIFLRKEASTTRHPITDVLGSVIALSDATGGLSTQYSFDPYGNVAATGAATTNSQIYTGREDDGTGLLYYRARYYSPSLARFVSEDPIGWAAGQANLYAFVSGNPISYADPLGLRGGPGIPGWGGSVKPPGGACSSCPVRAPDYVNFQIDYGVVSVWGTFGRSGNTFVGAGVNRTYPNPLGLGANTTLGWLNTCNPTYEDVNNFLGGYGGGGGLFFAGVGGGLQFSPGNGTATAVGLGVGINAGSSPRGAGGPGLGYSTSPGSTGFSW